MSKRIYLLGKWCYLPLFLQSSDEGGDVKKCVRTSYATHPHLEKSVNAYINLGMPVRPRQFMSFCMVVRTFLIQITCFLLGGWQKVPTETLSIIKGPIISGAHCDNSFFKLCLCVTWVNLLSWNFHKILRTRIRLAVPEQLFWGVTLWSD